MGRFCWVCVLFLSAAKTPTRFWQATFTDYRRSIAFTDVKDALRLLLGTTRAPVRFLGQTIIAFTLFLYWES